VLALASVTSLMVALDALVVATTLSTIRVDLGASIEALQRTMSAYNLSFAVLLLTGTALGDRFGRQRMFVASLRLFVAASAACRWCPSPSPSAQQKPEAVEGNGQTDEPQHAMAVIGRLVGTFEPALVTVAIDHTKSASARANTIAPSQPAGTTAGTNGKGMSQLSASAATTATAHAIGGRIMTFAVSVVSAIAGQRRDRSQSAGGLQSNLGFWKCGAQNRGKERHLVDWPPLSGPGGMLV